MQPYEPVKMMRMLRGLYRERHRLYKEAVALKTQGNEVLRRFRDGVLAGDKARALVYAIHDRLELIRYELLPMVERRANALALEYLDAVKSKSRIPGLATKTPARARRPDAGEELRN